MKKSKRRVFSGSSIEQAVTAAAGEYEINASEVAFKQVDKHHGFLRNRKRFVIEVDPKAPQLAPGATNEVEIEKPAAIETAPGREGGSEKARGDERLKDVSAPPDAPEEELVSTGPVSTEASAGPVSEEPEATEATAESTGSAALADVEVLDEETPGVEMAEEQAVDLGEEDLREGQAVAPATRQKNDARDDDDADSGDDDYDDDELTPAEEAVDILVTVTGLDLDWEIEETADRVEVSLEGPDSDLLLREHGKSLFAIEHLLPKVIRGISGEKVFCQVDSQGFRENRRQELEDLALSAAEEVKDTGEPKTLPLLNPSERRIVHMTLADDGDVETESEGGGYLKRLTVWPS